MNNSEVIEAPHQERRDVTPPANPVQMALASVGMSPCPNLSAAVAAARDKCKRAIKSSYNEYHKFWYASADDVIDTANEALEGSGLAVLPLEGELVTVGSGNSMYFALNRLLVLTHSSGEFTPLKIRGWPVIPERGRPLDKAFAIALTSSLAYLLRDLLQMPRGKEEDAASQDDRATPVRAQPANGTTAPPANPQTGPLDTATVDRLSGMIEQLKLDWAGIGRRLMAAYQVGSLALLTPSQAAEVESGLATAIAARQSQPAPVPSATSAGS